MHAIKMYHKLIIINSIRKANTLNECTIERHRRKNKIQSLSMRDIRTVWPARRVFDQQKGKPMFRLYYISISSFSREIFGLSVVIVMFIFSVMTGSSLIYFSNENFCLFSMKTIQSASNRPNFAIIYFKWMF